MDSPKKVPETAYWMASVRSHSSIIDDQYAQAFVKDRESLLAQFSHLKRPAISVAVCHRAIDEHLTVQLGLDPGSQIILIGAGFDTRAYRLDGGIWFEIDDKHLIEEKELTLSSKQAKNPLTRIGVNYGMESVASIIPFLDLQCDHPVIVVLEGVINHLQKNEILALFSAITSRYPNAILIMDIMSSAFLNKYATDYRDTVSRLGSPYQFLLGDPKTFFQEHGYAIVRQVSITEKGEEYGERKIPGWIKKLFLQSMVTGYCIYFVRRAGPAI